MGSTSRRLFAAAEADELAETVADYDPDTPREEVFVPEDRDAADAGVEQLAARLQRIWPSIRKALKNASDSAGFLSDDRLQGIAELIQNADDLGATRAVISVDTSDARLLFAHNGEGLTLHDVWALAIPWLSLKASDDEKLGRFGIGLKTLQSLSDVLEVSEGNFNIRFDPDTLTALKSPISWPGNPDAPSDTVFAVPFVKGTVTSDDVEEWLTAWGEAGLVFLRSLSRITLIDHTGSSLAELHLRHGPDEELGLANGTVQRRTVTASDGREWIVYTRRVPAPAGQVRSGKASASLTPIALALPQFSNDRGHLHVGLPVREIGLPFRVLAQFDPQANRRDIADTDWNLALVPPLCELWLDAAHDTFERTPQLAWSTVPLEDELDDDDRTTGRLRDALEGSLLHDARLALASSLRLDGGGERLPFGDLAYEAAELTAFLTAEDIQTVAQRRGAISEFARSGDRRWRQVLAELEGIGADTPTLVTVQAALALLIDEHKSPHFVADLVGVGVGAGMAADLEQYPCLVLHDGSRAVPQERGDLEVLIPPNSGELWSVLGMGSRLHSAFSTSAQWDAIRHWLHDEHFLRIDATDSAALSVLSHAGENGEQLAAPLTDGQLDAIRKALETLGDDQRQRLGKGIGQAVLLDGTRYDSSGTRVPVHVCPAEAYLIENDRTSWSVAAGKTPNLTWLHRRYGTELRNPSRGEGIGAQRLFRLLGAESAPRIIRHPRSTKRYASGAAGVARFIAGAPARRTRILGEHQATYTVGDWSSPDLDAVLNNIAAEKTLDQRRRRALATLATLSRAWGRLSEFATVMAAGEDYGWTDKGSVEAWWLSSAGSIPWLTSERGKPATPDDLSIRSSANVLLHGDDPDLYLDRTLDVETAREVLARVGVSGDPTVSELIEKLEEVRDDRTINASDAQELAVPLYQALAVEARGARLGQLTSSAARARFGRGEGLIATNAGWRRPSVVFSGPPRFGAMRDFVPAASGTERLWNLLGMTEPTAADARSVLADLAKSKGTDAMVMLEALRLLAADAPDPAAKKGRLSRSAVWVGDHWTNSRPVYAIANPLIAEALKGQLPIWEPGGSLIQFDNLIEPYGLTRLDTPNGQVVEAETAEYDPDLTQIFSRAVLNLRTDLSASDPTAEETLTMSWEQLANFRVAVLADPRVRLVEASNATDVTVPLEAWLDIGAETLYLAATNAAGKPSAGGYALASAFSGDARRISHDWVAAWSAASDGYQAELLSTAARIAADQERGRDQANEERLKALAERGKAKRQGKPAKGQSKAANGGTPGTASARIEQPPRLLIDPDELELRNEDGELVGGATPRPATAGERGRHTSGDKPKAPRPDDPRKPPSGGRPRPNYTDEERETVGLDLVRRILGGDEQAVVDIRHQHNVGADAIDDLRNFYELKVHSGRIPADVSLTRDEYLRARDTDDFFLVIVGHVEQADADPEVLIITDPLHQLEMKPSGSVSLSGVRSAKALRYSFHRPAPDGDDSDQAAPGETTTSVPPAPPD